MAQNLWSRATKTRTETPGGKSQINDYKALSLERKMIVPLPYVGPLVLVQTCRTCREPAEQAL